jgi:hypothetical protein
MLINTDQNQPTVKAALLIEQAINGKMMRSLELDSPINPKGAKEAIISPCGANDDKVQVIYYRQLIKNGQVDSDLEIIKSMLPELGLTLVKVSGRTALKIIELKLS